jgi:uncharacterized membrane protein
VADRRAGVQIVDGGSVRHGDDVIPFLRREGLGLAVLLAQIALSAARWHALPDRVPAHWDLFGRVDRWGTRTEAALFAPALSTALWALLAGLRRWDARLRDNAGYAVIAHGLLVFLLVVHAAVLWQLDVPRVLGVATGVFFVVLGEAMVRLEPNRWAGIRTPWTLGSRRSWTTTHRVGRWWFVGSGVVIAVASLVRQELGLAAIVLSALGGLPVFLVVSWRAWRDDPDRAGPRGAL